MTMTLKELSEVEGRPPVSSIWIHHKFNSHGMTCTIPYNRILWGRYKKTEYYESVDVHDERFDIILIKFNNRDEYYHGVRDAINILKSRMLNNETMTRGHYTYINGMFDYTHSNILDEFDLIVRGYRVIAIFGNIMVYGSETRNDMYVVIPDLIIGKRIPVYIDSRENINVFSSLMSRVNFVNQP